MCTRTPLFLCVLTLTALVTAPALAEKSASRRMTLSLGAGVEKAQKGDDESDDAPPKPEGSATVAPSDDEGDKPEAPGASHTVEKGDTLWDLSQRYLGSPWYWPKVWSYNPEIANPHWIYPGNVVRFASGAEEAPTQVEVGNGPAPEEVADVDEGELVNDEDKVLVAGKIGYVPKHSLTITAPSFVTTREIEESGNIKGSFSETELLSFPFQAYVEFKAKRAARVGESFVVFKTVRELLHPETKEPVGFLTKLLGVVKILRVDKSGLATVDIVRQFDEIKRGDLIGPMGESLSVQVSARPNERDVKGATLISGATPYLTLYGEHQMVIVDKGSDDGVKVGNTFTAFRQSDTNAIDALLTPNELDEQWPREDVGTCMAVEVKAKASTCLVIRAMRDLVRGEHLEMRATAAKSAARP